MSNKSESSRRFSFQGVSSGSGSASNDVVSIESSSIYITASEDEYEGDISVFIDSPDNSSMSEDSQQKQRYRQQQHRPRYSDKQKSIYDLNPVGNHSKKPPAAYAPGSSYAVDPFAFSPTTDENKGRRGEISSPSQDNENVHSDDSDDDDDYDESINQNLPDQYEVKQNTFLAPGDIHPNMECKQDEIEQLRLLAGKLSPDWGQADFMAPALARRIRDFQFAQEKRRKKYGDERPWGILGVYDHLSSIRIDVEWAEDAALRRVNGEPYQSWADFDEDKKGGSNRPYFTYVLLFVCTVVMLASVALNQWTIEPLDENPMVGPSAETLILMGGKEARRIVNQKEGWRLLTASVLHAGFVHYIVNMLALWFVGAAIEMSHGSRAAMIIFSLSAVGGSILSAIFLPEFVSVGASGGIFGFIGACLADIIMNWRLLFCDFVTENGKKHRHAIVVVVLVFDIILNSIIGLTPYVDNYNHLGGMIYGFLLGLSTIERLSTDFFGFEEGIMAHAKHICVRFFGLIITLVAIIATLILLLNGDATKTPCPSCTWLSCVPFPPWESNNEKWWYCDDCGRVTADVVKQPSLHLEIDCPSGVSATVELDEATYSRDQVQKNLPQYCREICPIFEASQYNPLL